METIIFSKMSVTLGYWDTRAICEPIRLMLHYCEINFNDKRYKVGPPPHYDKNEWNSVKNEVDLDIPNLPYLIDDENGVKLTQMHAILYYLGEKYQLQGRTAIARSTEIQILEGLRDWIYEFFDVTYCNAPWIKFDIEPVHNEGENQCCKESHKFRTLSQKYVEDRMKYHLNLYSNILQKNINTKGQEELQASWVIDVDRISYVDFVLAEYLMQHLVFSPTCLENYPLLQRYVERFRSLPTISKYLRSENYRAEPLHNRYSHFHEGWI